MTVTLKQALDYIRDCNEQTVGLLKQAIAEQPLLLVEKSEGWSLLNTAIALNIRPHEHAALAIRREVISFLIQASSSYNNGWLSHPLNSQAPRDLTPLHIALMLQDDATVEALLATPKVNLSLMNDQGETPYALAKRLEVGQAFLMRLVPPPPLTHQLWKWGSAATSRAWKVTNAAVTTQLLPAVSALLKFPTDLPQRVSQPVVSTSAASTAPTLTIAPASPDVSASTSSHVPVITPPVLKERKFSQQVQEAHFAIKMLDFDSEQDATLIAFQGAVNNIMVSEQQFLDMTAAQVAPIQKAFDLLSETPKEQARPHLKILSEELHWNLKVSLPTLGDEISSLSSKLNLDKISDARLIAQLHELICIITALQNPGKDADAQYFNQQLLIIIKAAKNLMDAVENQSDKVQAATEFSQKVIPAIMTLEGSAGEQWYEPLRNVILKLINLLCGNELRDTTQTTVIQPVKNRLGLVEAWKLSNTRKSIDTLLSSSSLRSAL